MRAIAQSDVHAVSQLMSEVINERLNNTNPLSRKLYAHFLSTRGKQLRSLLLLLIANACGYQKKHHISLGAAIEFFHTATLLHDDVIDDSLLRRGIETANKKLGSKISILGGDFLYTKSLQFILKTQNQHILNLFIHCAQDIIDGEIEQLSNKNIFHIDENRYFQVIKAKTALLFKISAEMGAMVSHASEGCVEAMSFFGLHIGNAFQIIDDTIDYSSDSDVSGKNPGDDLKDGKMTLPLIYAAKHADKSSVKIIERSITQGSLDHFKDIRSILDKTNALNLCIQRAQEEVDSALSALSVLPNSQYKEGLEMYANFALKRAF